MRLIIAGCEYSGASTLARAIGGWAKDNMGVDMAIYDSFKLPYILPLEMTDEELNQFPGAAPAPEAELSVAQHGVSYDAGCAAKGRLCSGGTAAG